MQAGAQDVDGRLPAWCLRMATLSAAGAEGRRRVAVDVVVIAGRGGSALHAALLLLAVPVAAFFQSRHLRAFARWVKATTISLICYFVPLSSNSNRS